MDTADWQVTNFYDEEGNLRNRIKAKSGPRENTIEVFHNNEKLIIDLITRKQERTEIIFKKPHKVISDYWDNRLEKLNDYIAQQVEKINTSAPNEINHLAENLFVDKSRAEVVTANLEEVKMALQDLKLRLEKLHYAYGAD
jgi:MoxR-like ATPase